ncbi:hypothetical protein LTR09_012520 [Extremus antarcticus]|uniref:P-loop containing nucleoside triphosphate hydrolase protein n=1 Tax=Extremus antarcticus TaxID=702011 RepID=A0AAJ0D9Q9_9PEZI|nr:hypothetical protein LTR09_012520 [Extremus antarcticus]
MAPEAVATMAETLPAKAKSKQTTLADTIKPHRTREMYDIRPHPVTGRLIDSHPGTRTRPMRVLCLGISRTGTMSLFMALQLLGFNPYHMAVALGSPKSNLKLWSEGLNANFNYQGKKWGREEFDKLLGNYDAVLDVPSICFIEDLVAAYPQAKIVLTQRDVDAWLKSMASTAERVLSWNWDLVAPWDHALAGPFWEHAKTVMPIAFGGRDFSSADTPARKKFEEHYVRVRWTVPKEKLLEYTVQEGWYPLCKFLDVAVPDEEFPRVNDAKQFVSVHALMWWLAFGKMVGKVGLMFAVPTVCVAAAVWCQTRR